MTAAQAFPPAAGEGPGAERAAFRDWLIARSASNLGSAVTTAVLPLVAVLTLRSAPPVVALLVAVPMATTPLGRLAAASHAERSHGRIGPLVLVDIARLITLATIPLAFALGTLSATLLIIQAGALGALAGAFGSYGAPFVVSIVPRDALVKANGALTTSSRAADVLGPGVAAGLLEIVQPPVALVVEIAAYLVAIPALVRLGQRQKSAGSKPASPVAPTMTAGSTEPERPPVDNRGRAAFLAPFTHTGTSGRLAVLFVGTLLNGTVLAELAVFMVRDLHIAASLVAGVGAIGAIGGVAAGLLVSRLTDTIGERRTLSLGVAAMALSTVFLPLAQRGLVGLWPCLVYELLGSVGATVFIVLTFTAVQRDLPRSQLARAMAAAGLVPETGQLFGAGLAGAAVSVISVISLLRIVAVIGVLLTALSVADLARSHQGG
ncbi:MAG: MFS transporter [Acidimicrobiales bacterium]